jgi:23S rRNA (uracil1939-C5)-methyltransferase
MQVTIHSLSFSGKGVATIAEDGFHRSVFVDGGVPGDVLEVELTRKKKIYYEAKILKIITPSPHRVKPPCPHFGECGACDYLHIDYETQLAEKEKLLRYYLVKAEFDEPPLTVIGAPSPLQYRDKVRVRVDKGQVGFYAKKSNTIVPITHCDIIKEELNVVFSDESLRTLPFKTQRRYAYDYATKRVVGEADALPCTYYIADIPLLFSPTGFVQNNLALNEQLVTTVLSCVTGDNVLDLYAGNGNFSIPLAKQVAHVVAVEGDKLGHDLLVQNSKANHITNLTPVLGDANNYPATGYDTVILDPPRTGAQHLERIDAQTIIYVSCDPTQMVKDVKHILGYDLHQAFLLDMFPQTRHFETVLVLKKI